MKYLNYTVVALLLSLSLGSWTDTVGAASSGKGGTNQRGGKAAEHTSEKGTLNSNGQWSADPERGWVRSEERHKIHDERAGRPNRVKQNNGKSKDKGKANKS